MYCKLTSPWSLIGSLDDKLKKELVSYHLRVEISYLPIWSLPISQLYTTNTTLDVYKIIESLILL